MLAQQLEHLFVGQAATEAALAPGHVRRSPERVQHRLLCRLDGRGEERVERAPLELSASGREGQEDLAAAVVGDRADPREAEAGAARDPLERGGPDRRVGRDDGDAAPARLGQLVAGEQAADGDAGDRQLPRRAEVRQHEHADEVLADPSARRADPALPAEAAMPVPAPTAPSANGQPARAVDGAAPRRRLWTCTVRASLSQPSSHSPTTGITNSSTPTSGSSRTATSIAPSYDAADGVRRSQVDGRLEHAPLADLVGAGQLAGAVEHGHPGRERQRRRDDRGDAGAGRLRGRRATRSRGRRGRPSTSAIELLGPGSSSPMRTPSSRGRGPRGSGGPSGTGGL